MSPRITGVPVGSETVDQEVKSSMNEVGDKKWGARPMARTAEKLEFREGEILGDYSGEHS